MTGGAGYIGPHAVFALEEVGYNVVVLDSLEYGHAEILKQHTQAELIVGHTSDSQYLDHLFKAYNFAAAMHFAAYIAAGQSIREPAQYY